MNKKKKPVKSVVNKAEIAAFLVTKKSFSLQRLMHDYNEIKNQINPIGGVSACPLDDNFYEWHGNIKASTTNIYKGSVLHFKFVFQKDYPLSAPKIYLLNKDFTHPNVLPDGSICLDMLTTSTEPYKGWKSGYTVLSILIQLQNFFFDVDENFITISNREIIKEQVIKMNQFKCPNCKHSGSSNAYPEIPPENKSKFNLNPEQYREAKLNELCCYLRRTNFKETPLGLGVTISRVFRTQQIKNVKPCFDFISFKCFTKERLRVSFNGEKFTHFFPIFFGYEPEKYLKSVQKAISMIAKGNTKEFNPNLILEVMTKLFNNICINVISENIHNSSRALEILIYIFRILILLLKNFPSFEKEVNEKIENFIKDEKNRLKDKTPSLGDLLVMICLSSHSIEELLPFYLDESLDRQIFWILNEIPELEKLIDSSEIDDVRTKICFKCGLVSEQIILFYYYFIKNIIYKECKTLDEFAAKLDKNFGNLTDNELDVHRNEIKKILKIDNFNDFYKYLNLNVPTEKEMNEKFKQAFKNSLKKGYHGFDSERFVPEQKKQIETYFEKYPKITELVENNQLLPENNPKWKELVNKFDLVSLFKYTNPTKEISPLNLIRFMRKNLPYQIFWMEQEIEEEKDKINERINSKCFVKEVEDEKIIKNFSFKQLYLKLYVEEYVKYFPFIADFKELYKLLDLVKNDMIHFTFYISDLGILKSDYNYVRVILSKLIKLKYLEFIFSGEINMKLLKNILKGISLSIKENSSIEYLKIRRNNNEFLYNQKDLNILTMLDKLPTLKVLDLSHCKLDINQASRIRNHLYYYNKIEVLDLSNCNLNDVMAKEIADGLMRAKSLEKLYLNNNDLNLGLSSILYNLAFQPSIKILDISNNQKFDKKETQVSLYKLIKMSSSIEYLLCNNNKGLNELLTNDFYKSIGDCNSLKYLDINSSGKIKDLESFGNSIAFNALKNGNLFYIDVSNNSLVYNDLYKFVEGLKVSESQHFIWYGFTLDSNIQKNNPQYFMKTFHCNLEVINFSNSNFITYDNINDPKNSNMENYIKTLLKNDKKLDTLLFNKCSINNYFLDMISNALQEENNLKYISFKNSNIKGDNIKSFFNAFYKKDKKEINPEFHIEAINLSNNNLGYDGIENLCKCLKENKTVKYINLFHNIFDVNGARRLAEVIKINNTLVEIDLGYNRIKNVGFNSIINSIIENENSQIKFLGVKYNFIKENSFEDCLKKLSEKNNNLLEEIHFKNNSLKDTELMKYYEEFYKNMKKKISVDVFNIIYFLEPERLNRTIWCTVAKGKPNSKMIYDEIKKLEKKSVLEDETYVGIPLFIRKKRGRKTGKKKEKEAYDNFIEFILPNSVNKLQKLSLTKGFFICGKKAKFFKAGTKPDFFLVKKKVFN